MKPSECLSAVQSPVAPLKVFSGGWWNTMAVSCKHAMSTLVLSLGLMWATSSAPLGSDGNQHDIHTLLLHLKCLELHRMLTNRKWHGSGSFSSNEWQTIIRVRGFARFHQYVDYFHLLSFKKKKSQIRILSDSSVSFGFCSQQTHAKNNMDLLEECDLHLAAFGFGRIWICIDSNLDNFTPHEKMRYFHCQKQRRLLCTCLMKNLFVTRHLRTWKCIPSLPDSAAMVGNDNSWMLGKENQVAK